MIRKMIWEFGLKFLRLCEVKENVLDNYRTLPYRTLPTPGFIL